MDGWGALRMLINRQQADKWRKSELRDKLQQRKDNFTEKQQKTQYNFPKLSYSQMKNLKDQIREEYKKEKQKEFFIIIILIILAFIFIFFVFS